MKNEFQLQEVLLNLEQALLDIHRRVLKIEEYIFRNDGSSKTAIQELDYIIQSLYALSEFSASVAIEISVDEKTQLTHAFERIPLASLLKILDGTEKANTNEGSTKMDGSKGAVDFF